MATNSCRFNLQNITELNRKNIGRSVFGIGPSEPIPLPNVYLLWTSFTVDIDEDRHDAFDRDLIDWLNVGTTSPIVVTRNTVIKGEFTYYRYRIYCKDRRQATMLRLKWQE